MPVTGIPVRLYPAKRHHPDAIDGTASLAIIKGRVEARHEMFALAMANALSTSPSRASKKRWRSGVDEQRSERSAASSSCNVESSASTTLCASEELTVPADVSFERSVSIKACCVVPMRRKKRDGGR